MKILSGNIRLEDLNRAALAALPPRERLELLRSLGDDVSEALEVWDRLCDLPAERVPRKEEEDEG